MITSTIRRVAREKLAGDGIPLCFTEEQLRDPVVFAEQVLGLRCWGKQAEVLRALVDNHRVAVRSGHKVGKSALLTSAALWWTSHPNSVVIMTMATARQIKLILWKELRYLAGRSKFAFPKPPKDPGTGLFFENGSFIVGFSTDNTENMGGFSGSRLLFVVDEASGVAEEIFEAIEGNMAGGSKGSKSAVAKLIMAGNPTQTSGSFFNAFNSAMQLYSCHHISSEDTPNAREGKVIIPGLATADYVEDRKLVWGEDSPLYQVRVKGNFPTQGSNSVIFLADVLDSINRIHSHSQYDTLHIGVDVARFGDDLTCIASRKGDCVLDIVTLAKQDEVAVAEAVIREVNKYQIQGAHEPIIKVDTTGIGGGVASILRTYSNIVVIEVNSSERANEPEKYPNKRSELWFNLSDWIKERGALLDDKDLLKDLIAPVYVFDGQGRRVVEAKKDLKKRLKHSPDRADALALSVYMPQAEGSPVAETVPDEYRYDQGFIGY